MTDKEKIIIDGVDVSKCYRYQKKTGYCKGAFKPEELPFCENFDCLFKQLARKTQECEKLKEENQELRNSLSGSLMFRFTSQDKEVARYRKALEEIEGIAKNFGSYAAWQEQRINKILDIINKAKGEGDEDT